MSSFQVIALPSETAAQVRASGKAPRYGHPAHTELASGYGPCRHCLRIFRIGQENRTLFTYDPFAGIEAVPLPGPIFIHEQPCTRYSPDAGYPADLEPYAVVLNGYAAGQKLVERTLVSAAEDKTAAVRHLLERPDIDYIEVRDQTAGCFDFRIERVGAKVFQCCSRKLRLPCCWGQQTMRIANFCQGPSAIVGLSTRNSFEAILITSRSNFLR